MNERKEGDAAGIFDLENEPRNRFVDNKKQKRRRNVWHKGQWMYIVIGTLRNIWII